MLIRFVVVSDFSLLYFGMLCCCIVSGDSGISCWTSVSANFN